LAFPTSVEASTYFLEAYDNLSTELTQVFGVSDTTAYVTSTDNFGSIGFFTVEDEVVSYTGKAAGSFTGCSRGVGGTTPVEHATGKQVSLTYVATAHNRIVAELRAVQTKVGSDSSAVTSTHAYKLSGVTGTDKAVSLAAAETLTNKRITKRVGAATSATTHTIDSDSYDAYNITAQAVAANIAAPTGTPTNEQSLVIRIKDNGTARALTFNSIFRASSDLALPTTTVISKTMYLGFIYNSTDTKWDYLAYLDNI
jgi:hypothetical protein